MDFGQWAKQGEFWGKVSVCPDTNEVTSWLPLRQHCIDVAQVLLQLLRAPHISLKLDALTGHPVSEAHKQRLAVLCYFHDLGKLSLGFQSKVFSSTRTWPRTGHTDDALNSLFSGQPNAERTLAGFPHAEACAWLTNGDDPLSAMLQASWSHHGAPVRMESSFTHAAFDNMWAPREALDAATELTRMVAVTKAQFPLAWEDREGPLNCTPALAHYFAGLVMLADWLGSNREFFPLTQATLTDEARIALARDRADKLLTASLLAGAWPHAKFQGPEGLSFESLFGRAPRPLQQAIAGMSVTTAGVHTLVAESDTGSGKTEAALLWWAKLRAEGLVQGLYFALPTRVSARELYLRVCRFVETTYAEGERPQVLLAVPGYVQLSEGVALPPEDTLYPDDEALAALARVWAGDNAKRFLAAPIVVGTVDQALLAMLQNKHAHLRNTLLDRHLLVVDEVHASDVYMQSVLVDLLEHRRARGCWNLLLSATLGSHARAKLLGEKGGPSHEAAAATPYPLVSGERGLVVPVPGESRQKQVRVTPVPHLNNLEECARQVASAVADGARVLVVMNTVRRAVEMQKLVEAELGKEHPALFRVAGVACPHHGRYAAQDRLLMDRAVQSFLGAGSSDGPKVLIGTQTLEQSLDIDADVLFTDLCPVDVLLQRLGRLWRHERTTRPEAWSAQGVAQCRMLVPEHPLEVALGNKASLGDLRRAGIGSVYPDLRVLALTWEQFSGCAAISIPAQNRELVEQATHPETLKGFRSSAWTAHVGQLKGKEINDRSLASVASAKAPFSANFGAEECVFAETGAPTRIGEGGWLAELDHDITSPFGQKLASLQVPASVLRVDVRSAAASTQLQRKAQVLSSNMNGSCFQWCGNTLNYGRFGLTAS